MKQSEEFRQRTGARLVRSDKPDYDLRAAALGLALANPLADATGIDLARTLKPAVSIGDVFPYGELLLHGVLLGRRFVVLDWRGGRGQSSAQGHPGWSQGVFLAEEPGSAQTRRREEVDPGTPEGGRRFPRHTRQLVRLAANDRRRDAGKHHHHHARRRRRNRSRIAKSGPSRGKEEADRQLRDSAGRKWLVAARDRRLPRRLASRRDTQAALSAGRGLRLSGQSGQAGLHFRLHHTASSVFPSPTRARAAAARNRNGAEP